MGKSAINCHFQEQTVGLPERTSFIDHVANPDRVIQED